MYFLNCIVQSVFKYHESDGINDIGTQKWNQGRTEEIKERVLHIGGNDAEFAQETINELKKAE